jgi:hypothetical protein
MIRPDSVTFHQQFPEEPAMPMRSVCCFLFSVAFICFAGMARAEGQREVTILFSGDMMGYSSPVPACGGKTTGGVARVATVRRELAGSDSRVVLVDAGGVYPSQSFGPTASAMVHKVGLEAMRATGYDALNLAAIDLQDGIGLVDQAEKEFDLPLVTTNMVYVDTGKPFKKPYIVTDAGGVRVAVLGISRPDALTLMPSARLGTVLTILPPEEALAAVLPRVKAESDVIVLLSHNAYGDTTALMERFPDIDLAVVAGADANQSCGCKAPTGAESAVKPSDRLARVFPVFNRLSMLGELKLRVGGQGRPEIMGFTYLPLDYRVALDEEITSITGKDVYRGAVAAMKVQYDEMQRQMERETTESLKMSPEDFFKTLQTGQDQGGAK